MDCLVLDNKKINMICVNCVALQGCKLENPPKHKQLISLKDTSHKARKLEIK